MSTKSHLQDLAEQISATTAVLSKFLAASNLPEPSFNQNSPFDFPSGPEDIEFARRTLREATKELHDLVTGPREHIRWLSCYYHDCSSLRWIYHFNIAAHVPLDAEIAYADIAAAAQVPEPYLRRILRQAMTNHIFCEPRVGFVAHTAQSRTLVDDKGTLNWIGYTLEESYPASAKVVESLEKYGYSEEKNKSGWNVAFGTDEPIFDHLTKHPARAERFAETMTALTNTENYNVRYILDGYPWEALGHGTVVDVGGSVGHASIALAEKFPDLKFVVQDRSEIITTGEPLLDASLKDRVTFQAHDFFTPQPVQGADAYLLRFILHDYSDKHATFILKALLPALKSNSRLIVMDGVLPQPGTMPRSEERFIRVMDLEMLTNFNSKERAIEDWQALFTAADPRLRIRSVNKPTGSVSSIIEVVLE